MWRVFQVNVYYLLPIISHDIQVYQDNLLSKWDHIYILQCKNSSSGTFKPYLCVVTQLKNTSHMEYKMSLWALNKLTFHNVVACLCWQVDFLAVHLQIVGLFLWTQHGLWRSGDSGSFCSDGKGINSCILVNKEFSWLDGKPWV